MSYNKKLTSKLKKINKQLSKSMDHNSIKFLKIREKK